MKITVEDKDISFQEYTVHSKMTSKTYALERRIDDYWNKNDVSLIKSSLTDYFCLQLALEHKFERENSELSEKERLVLACALSSQYSLDNLPIKTEINFFSNKQISFDKDKISQLNDQFTLYARALGENMPLPALEDVTSSFFQYLHRHSLQEIGKSETLQKSQPLLIFRGKPYDLKNKSPGNNVKMMDIQTFIIPPEKQIKEDYIYGHEKIKKEFLILKKIIDNPEIFQARFSPKHLYKNYLLMGPPGTGKTTLVSTIAANCGLETLIVPCSQIGSSFVNGSAQALQDLYEQAKQRVTVGAKGVIVFLDEIDHLTKKRTGHQSAEDDKVVTTLNNYMDGISRIPQVITIGATNHPEVMDDAILSRFNKFEIGYPQTDEEIIGIHQAIIRKMQDYSQTEMFDQIDYQKILKFSRKDERYKSGRVIEHVLRDAALNVTLEYCEKGFDPISLTTIPLTATANVFDSYQRYQLEERKTSISPPFEVAAKT